MHKIPWDFELQMDHFIPVRRPDLEIPPLQRTCRRVDFAVHWTTIEENKKSDKYLDLARDLKCLWNMRVKMIPVVIGTLGSVRKDLGKELEALEIGG